MSIYLFRILLQATFYFYVLCRSILQQMPMFTSFMKPQRISTLQVFSAKITVQPRVVLNVGPLYVSADVRLPAGGFPTDRAVPHPVHLVHHGLYLSVKRREQI